MYLVWRYIMFKAKYGIRWQQQCCCNTSMKFTWWTLWTRPLNDKSVPSSGGSLSPLPGRSNAITWIFRGRFCGKNSQYRISFKIIQHVLNPVYIFIKCIAGGIKQGKCRYEAALGLLWLGEPTLICQQRIHEEVSC